MEPLILGSFGFDGSQIGSDCKLFQFYVGSVAEMKWVN